MSKILRAAIEEEQLNIKGPETIELDTDIDSQNTLLANELNNESVNALVENKLDEEVFINGEKNGLAIEELIELSNLSDTLVNNGQCTETTLELIQKAAEPHLEQLEIPEEATSLESNKSIEDQHVLATEGFWNNYAQQVVLSFKHVINAVSDLFASKNKDVLKYKGKLNTINTEWTDKSKSLRQNEQDVSLDQLWYYFANTSGQVTKIKEALLNEVKLSDYVINKYTPNLMTEFSKLISIVKSTNLSKANSIESITTELSKLKKPVDLFEQSYLKEMFLNVSNLELVSGKQRKPFDLNNKYSQKIAELASVGLYSLKGSLGHNALKTGANVHRLGGIVSFLLSKNLVVKNSDVPAIIKSGETLLDNAGIYYSDKHQFRNKVAEFNSSMEKLLTSTDTLDNNTQKLITQINQIGMNYIETYKRTGSDVADHSIKGGKYVGYLVNRIIWNAK